MVCIVWNVQTKYFQKHSRRVVTINKITEKPDTSRFLIQVRDEKGKTKSFTIYLSDGKETLEVVTNWLKDIINMTYKSYQKGSGDNGQ